MDISHRISRIRDDRTSGASELVSQAAHILSEVLAARRDVRHVAAEIVRAQPSMAPMWNLVACALRSQTNPALFSKYLERLERGPSILVRHGAQLLDLGAEARPLQLVTFSASRTVQLLLESAAQRRELTVACSEGRPALEGRRFAEILAAQRIPISFYTDAAVAQALGGADALLVGADAVSPTWVLNKTGTRMLAAAAAQQGVPVYVCATRDKFLSAAVAARLVIRDEPADEIWPSPPPGVTVRNYYFERIPLDLVSAVVSDVGVLDPSMIPEVCSSSDDRLVLNL